MTKEEHIAKQKAERTAITKEILESKEPRKLIVAGAGTGKTFTFSEVLKLNPDGANIAMTFIRLLRNDMAGSLSAYADVRTFHEFCKKILHERRGGFFLYPKLTTIIREDSDHLEIDCGNFDDKFQQLDESGNEIKFYLKRGDYYNTVAFNDSVYRMWRELQRDPSILDKFDQILIDEFQDFNPLEVAFIDELEKKGNILIVGDDDQAVYDSRFSTPHHLRKKHQSGHYKNFELPFCSRCTLPIVETTNEILRKAVEAGGLNGRLPKRYECFIELKDAENEKYPTITTAQITNVRTVIKFINKKIAEISAAEIAESWKEGSEYPTVLIVSKTQYLNPVFKSLSKDFANIKYKQSEKSEVNICDGYDFLSHNHKSNLGWRILIDFLLKYEDAKAIIKKTEAGTPMIDLLSKEFVDAQTKISVIISKLNKKGEDNNALLAELEKLVDKNLFAEIKARFLPEEVAEVEPEKTQPSILLTSYQGCKGMSAGFVFIIGANNGVMPANSKNVSDVEVCQFIVALTRTRKKCYILSEDWMFAPKDNRGKWIPKNERSIFIDLIPDKFLEDLGHLKSDDIN
ncbi:MAG: ATP-dependent helicase [Bacteroidetes bacterium]|nr:ATP-dependent helicase [Bacteroidota bacterium]